MALTFFLARLRPSVAYLSSTVFPEGELLSGVEGVSLRRDRIKLLRWA